MDNPNNISAAVISIIERREELCISAKQLAKLANVHVRTINRMESGICTPTWETRQKLRRALGLPEERYITVQERNEIFMELERPIRGVINRNRLVLIALHADMEDVYQDMALCAIRAIDRYDPQNATATSVKTFAMKNVKAHIKKSFAYFRCRGLGGTDAKNLKSGTVVSMDVMVESGMQFVG